VLDLLAGRPALNEVRKPFEDALRELGPGGNRATAISDAANALQSMLEALGAKGNSLGPMIRHSISTGLLRGHDAKFEVALTALVDWVNSDRSERGKAHHRRVRRRKMHGSRFA
jgi:hypothetical protein